MQEFWIKHGLNNFRKLVPSGLENIYALAKSASGNIHFRAPTGRRFFDLQKAVRSSGSSNEASNGRGHFQFHSPAEPTQHFLQAPVPTRNQTGKQMRSDFDSYYEIPRRWLRGPDLQKQLAVALKREERQTKECRSSILRTLFLAEVAFWCSTEEFKPQGGNISLEDLLGPSVWGMHKVNRNDSVFPTFIVFELVA